MYGSTTDKYKNSEKCSADWAQMQEKLGEMGAKFQTYLKESGIFDGKNDRVLTVSLNNGRQFSFSLGHILLIGVGLFLLPFKLILLAGVIGAVIYYNNRENNKSKNDDMKIKVDNGDDFDVYKV